VRACHLRQPLDRSERNARWLTSPPLSSFALPAAGSLSAVAVAAAAVAASKSVKSDYRMITFILVASIAVTPRYRCRIVVRDQDGSLRKYLYTSPRKQRKMQDGRPEGNLSR